MNQAPTQVPLRAQNPTLDAKTILSDVFGYDQFRPGQADIIARLTAGENLLVVMPTGAGKSLCYQIPAIMSGRLTVVVSPLLALMDDQVAALRGNGVEAACIHSGHDRAENIVQWRMAASGVASLLYLSPERLMTPRMIAALQRLPVAMFVVDEAHCISKWGANFRPEYEQLSRLGGLFPGAVLAAFTATADRQTRLDIAEKLFASQGDTILLGFDRPNLRLSVAAKTGWRQQLTDFLSDKAGQSGIVYCLSRKFTEEAAGFLAEQGHNALAYHAGLPSERRKQCQDRFMSEEGVIMVATIAFGMGIDKPDIRYVCHLNLPGSMEAYYQEIGRAGRDGAPAETLLLYGLDDMRMRRHFVDQDGEDEDHKRREHKRLDALLAYCESAHCRRTGLLAYFDEASQACGNCDNCLSPPDVKDGTKQAQMLFSAIADTGQYFGAMHIIDILRGAENQKVLDRRHDRLPSHGIGKAYKKDYWQSLIRQAVAGAYLSINIEKYGCLELTASAQQVMAGEELFMFRETPALQKKARGTGKSDRASPAAIVPEEDREILAALKALRLQLARQHRVPAYVVFPDATLIEMARIRPDDLDQMGAISGVGPKKLKNFGTAFLALTAGS